MSEKIKDGGPALPLVYTFDSIDHIPAGEIGAAQAVTVTAPGMTLRDYFAAKAMQSFMQGAVLPPGFDAAEQLALVGQRAYETADAMLAAREVKA